MQDTSNSISDTISSLTPQALQFVVVPVRSTSWKQRWRRHVRCMISAYLPNTLLMFFRYQPQRTSRSNWNAEYAGGHWDYLRSPTETARYGIISGFCHAYSNGRGLLDYGCGEGVLRRHLNLNVIRSYLGIDISLQAIANANQLFAGERTRFIAGDIEKHRNKEKFDVIVFNEVLYYLKDPVSKLKQNAGNLHEQGVFVVSMFDMIKSRKVWKLLDHDFQLVNSARAINHEGHSWTVRVYTLKTSPANHED